MIAQLNSSWTVRVEPRRAGRVPGRRHARQRRGRACSAAGSSPATPPPSRCGTPTSPTTHDYAADWIEVPDNDVFENGFKTQWEQFLRHVVEDAPHEFDFLAGARGVQLAEAGLESSRTGARVDLPELAAARARRDGRAMTVVATIDAAGRGRAGRRCPTRPPSAARPPRCAAASPTPPRTSCRGSAPRTSPAHPPTSTGTPPWPSATTSGRGASASPTPWTPRSATWAWTPRPPAS